MLHRWMISLFVLVGSSFMLSPIGVAAADPVSVSNFAPDYWPLADGNYWVFTGQGLEMTFAATELGPGEFRLDTYSNDFLIQREFYHIIDGDIFATLREQVDLSTDVESVVLDLFLSEYEVAPTFN